MGEAFMHGSIAYFSLCEGSRFKKIYVIEPQDVVRERLHREQGVAVFASVGEALDGRVVPETVFLAVKPDRWPQMTKELLRLPEEVLGISVMAGIPLASLERSLPRVRWVRTMSNLALTVAMGMTVVASGTRATAEDLSFAVDLFSRMGKAIVLPESEFDVATAVCGSGPGLLAVIADALADGGVFHGLKRETVQGLVAQTLMGTGALLGSGLTPSELKGQVSSPGGTTIEAIATLESRAVRGAMIEAVSNAVRKSRLLGEKSGSDGHGNG